MCESAFARLDRGAGLPALQRLPYFPQVGGWLSGGCLGAFLSGQLQLQVSCLTHLVQPLSPPPKLSPSLQEGAAALAPFQLLLLLDVRRPVANFGYQGAPSQLVALPVRVAGSRGGGSGLFRAAAVLPAATSALGQRPLPHIRLLH